MVRVRVQHNLDSWRDVARRLLIQDVPPDDVIWNVDGLSLYEEPAEEQVAALPVCDRPAPNVPKAFIRIAANVVYFRGAEAPPLLYRVLWRLTHGEPRLLDVRVDAEVVQLFRMEKAVRRDEHKMHAFVRFRRIVSDAGAEEFVAWHRPDHPIVPLAAPFFVRRFGNMRWTILTPDASARWDGAALQLGPGVPQSAAPQGDELEDLWRTYYGSIFNPARIKLKAMRREMPVRHWATLPESRIITDLLHDAPRRVEEMMKHQAACPATTSAASFVPARHDLKLLADAARGCQGCSLYCKATQTVFGEGPKDASVMFVGEQPGDQEDLAGKPFVGPSGQLLDEVMQEAGIARDSVYVTNAVKHFKFEPRGNRRIHAKPSSREVSACRPWLEAEIATVQPKLIVCLGATAAQSLLGPSFRVTQQRGQLLKSDWAPGILATVHPSSLLRIPDHDARAEARLQFASDLKVVAAHLRHSPARAE